MKFKVKAKMNIRKKGVGFVASVALLLHHCDLDDGVGAGDSCSSFAWGRIKFDRL